MADPIENTPIPDTPPSFSGATTSAMKGIAALKKACADGGFTSKYAVCSVLAVAGTESKWIPQEEKSYTTKNLLNMGASQADAEKYGAPGVPKKVSFGYIYGTRKGKPESEGNYYGRGFTQITGSGIYKEVGKLCTPPLDLYNHPELLVGTDDAAYANSANATIAHLKMRCKDLGIDWKSEQHKEGFINKVLICINPGEEPSKKHPNPPPSKGHIEKIKYYEYFLGGKAAAPPTNKDPVSPKLDKTPAEIDAAPPTKREAYTEDRTANFSTVGFTDPEGKYPLRDYMNEPDTNRLARGITDGTHINFKDSMRHTNVPVANGGMWDQPMSAYNTVYPLNKVFESESGHVLEFDDSPDGERINLFHSKGTFIEIDPNGSQINHIVGDGFYITEHNGNVLINGVCNITVVSDLNILCQGNANIEVNGTTDMVVHDDLNIGVAKDLNIAVGGEYNLLVEGNCNTQVGKTMNTRTIGPMSLESTDQLKLKTASNISMEGGDTASTAETLMKLSGDIKIETAGSYAIKAKNFTLDIEESTQFKSGTITSESIVGDVNVKSKGDINSLASTNFNVTATKIDLNGTAVEIPSIEPLPLLGVPAKPVDFGGNVIEGRSEEHVLVSTALSPVGPSNPNVLPEKAVEEILQGKTPTLNDILGSSGISGKISDTLSSVLGPQITNTITSLASSIFGIDSNVTSSLYQPVPKSSVPNIYDIKFDGPRESKSSLSATGGATNPYSKLQVPPSIGSNNQVQGNLIPPARHSGSVSKYEDVDDWNTAAGQAALSAITSTSDYQHNHVDPQPSSDPADGEITKPSGGISTITSIPADKLAEINGRSDFPLSYQLSPHFTLDMLIDNDATLRDQTALISKGGKSMLYTKQMIVANLTALSINVLEVIYEKLGPCQGGGSGATWKISSGFRNVGKPGRSQSSHHLKGRAVDIQLINNTIDNLYATCIELEKILPYQEYFMEYQTPKGGQPGQSHWIHVAFDADDKTKEVMTYVEQKPYKQGLLKLYS